MKRLFWNAIKNLCSNGGGYSENEKSFIKKCKNSENKAALKESMKKKYWCALTKQMFKECGYTRTEQDFIRAYKHRKNKTPFKKFMKMMGIKKAVILIRYTDNPYIIYSLNKLMKEACLETKIFSFRKFNRLSKKREIQKYLGNREDTIYIMEEYNHDVKLLENGPHIIFDLNRMRLYLEGLQKDFIKKTLFPIVNTIENCFASVGICGKNKAAVEIFEVLKRNKKVEVVYYGSEDLYWDNRSKTFRFTQKKCPEMFFHVTLYSGNIMFGKQMVFCIDIDNCLRCGYSDSVNADIAWNIIPYLNKNNIKTLIVSYADIERLKDKKELKKRMERNAKWKNMGFVSHSSSLWSSKEVLQELKRALNQVDLNKGYWDGGNQRGKYYNIVNGVRYTLGNIKKYHNKITVFGPCIIVGLTVKDADTIPSLLRNKIDKSYFIENRGSSYWNLNLTVRLAKFKPGDIVIIFVNDKKPYIERKIDFLDITNCYQKIPNLKDHIFDSLFHCDAYVHQYIAKELFQYMKRNNYFSETTSDDLNTEQFKKEVYFGTRRKLNSLFAYKGLKEWLDNLKKYKSETKGRCGAIVMNCNPFTRGHLYLIETAAREVDVLYVFVVQEDKSVFPFQDRIRLVKEGTKHISNVTVLPSGQYMISASTMPGYFEKEDLQNEKLDASQDLGIFSQYIAPALNITIRFAGEEPLDHFTRQYNESMKEIFPEYGIKFMEIPRKEEEGEVISASRVRRLLKEKKWEEIRKMVPDCTYEYLLDQKAKCF